MIVRKDSTKIKAVLLVVALGLVILFIAACGKSNNQSGPVVELNVSAAVSLKDVLVDLQQIYQKNHPQVKVLFNFGSTGSLQKQIEQGALTDIFISAASKQMDELEKQNLINKETRRNLAGNELALVVPQNSTLALTCYQDLDKTVVEKIALGEPSTVPAGQYAQQTLQKINLWDKIKAKIVFAKDVKAVLTYVETGNVDAGIVYKTDTLNNNKIKIIATAPKDSHSPIVYPAAILTDTKQAKTAEDFLTYLFSPDAKVVFEKYGFVVEK
ncbi:MAG: molybdate ABC transporter substrate-binding protein [Negativicutes bacterium]|jgi:molybdate transport system substrate-binding protein